ncbi:MAG: FBP domain-containing protein [Lacisediminihabitans sp.]
MHARTLARLCGTAQLGRRRNPTTRLPSSRLRAQIRPGATATRSALIICADLACSHIIRIAPPESELQPDPAEVIAGRVARLLERLESFAEQVMRSAV